MGPSSPAPGSPWESPSGCEAALAAGGHLPRPRGVARIGSWNVRWFPDGVPGKSPKKPKRTNVSWLACAIAWLDLDVLAVQEFKDHPAARRRRSSLLAALDRRTGGRWNAELDHCPNSAGQHVGLLYDARRVGARSFRELGVLNPRGAACRDQLRPGLAGHFTWHGGLSAHVVSVHLKSGRKRRALGLRRISISNLDAAYRELQAMLPDEDVVVAGDFNTMGCGRCSPKVDPAGEALALGRALERLEAPFRRVASSAACSEYYRGAGTLLDHFVVSARMREVPSAARYGVSGYCGESACGRLERGRKPRAYRELSDHCPIVLDIRDRDLP